MTESDQAARDSALNDAEFPDDERGLTGTLGPRGRQHRARGADGPRRLLRGRRRPGHRRRRPPDRGPRPRTRSSPRCPASAPDASVDFGTTASSSPRASRCPAGWTARSPTSGWTRPTTSAPRRPTTATVPQITQDGVSDQADSFTDSVTDDVIASGEDPIGGEGPEERAMHVTDG